MGVKVMNKEKFFDIEILILNEMFPNLPIPMLSEINKSNHSLFHHLSAILLN